MNSNVDSKLIENFGYEWSKFDQTLFPPAELKERFMQYFHLFPWEFLPAGAVGFDLGCGTGRWAKLAADKVGVLHCIDASETVLKIARKNLKDKKNCQYHLGSMEDVPLSNNSMDFGFSIGVLHHVPKPFDTLKSCVEKLKPEAPFLMYVYYRFDNRPLWFRFLWKISDIFRRCISQFPHTLKYWTTQLIAVLVYYPSARLAWVFEKMGFKVEGMLLSSYRGSSFYTMRTDALDRFGTRLEHRFTRDEIKQMMQDAGLERIAFNESPPYWCALGFKI